MNIPPPPLKHTQTCDRCGLETSIDEANCVHCYGKNESQLEAIKKDHTERLEAGVEIGKVFRVIAFIIAVIMLIFIFNL